MNNPPIPPGSKTFSRYDGPLLSMVDPKGAVFFEDSMLEGWRIFFASVAIEEWRIYSDNLKESLSDVQEQDLEAIEDQMIEAQEGW